MRALHTADVHLGLTRFSVPGTQSRIEDFAATLLRFGQKAIELQVGAVFIAGDLFNGRRPTPRELKALANFVDLMKESGIAIFIIGGNHDGNDRVADPDTHALGWLQPFGIHNLHVITTPFVHLFQTADDEDFVVIAIPYPHRGSFDAVMPEATPEQRIEEISKRLESAIDTLFDKAHDTWPDAPVIFTGHLSVAGAALGTEVTMKFGWDVTVRSGLLDRADAGLLGHIHRQQQIGEKSWYPGSPEYIDFGEAEYPKGFLLWDIQKRKPPKVEVIDSGARPMRVIDMTRSGDVWHEPSVDVKDAIVQLRISPGETEVTPLEVSRIVKSYRDRGASYIQPSLILPTKAEVTRVAINAQVQATEALHRWLVSQEMPLEPTLTEGADIIRRVGERQ